ncbi:MAG: Plug domain-containing protein [Candidatus Brocadiaceae bacterium]|nr:Plug domain-containing protein [Candidatus Brocadiaceae bacterium]
MEKSLKALFLGIVILFNLFIAHAYGLKVAEVQAGDDVQKYGQRDVAVSDERAQTILSAETLWLNFHEEVTISTRHEVPIKRIPSIVTVITYQEMKNAGYRTLIEVLRTAPRFVILKNSDFGMNMPTVRGLNANNRIRIMIKDILSTIS